MDLYWKITATAVIIGAIILIISVPFMLAESDFIEILSILIVILFGGGIVMAFIRIAFEVMKLIWTS